MTDAARPLLLRLAHHRTEHIEWLAIDGHLSVRP
jgi:hypothetical protein